MSFIQAHFCGSFVSRVLRLLLMSAHQLAVSIYCFLRWCAENR